MGSGSLGKEGVGSPPPGATPLPLPYDLSTLLGAPLHSGSPRPRGRVGALFSHFTEVETGVGRGESFVRGRGGLGLKPGTRVPRLLHGGYADLRGVRAGDGAAATSRLHLHLDAAHPENGREEPRLGRVFKTRAFLTSTLCDRGTVVLSVKGQTRGTPWFRARLRRRTPQSLSWTAGCCDSPCTAVLSWRIPLCTGCQANL